MRTIPIRKDNTKIMDIPEEEQRKAGRNLFKAIIIENFPNLGKELDKQIPEAKRTTNYLNAKRSSLRHIMLKHQKSMTRILAAARLKRQ